MIASFEMPLIIEESDGGVCGARVWCLCCSDEHEVCMFDEKFEKTNGLGTFCYQPPLTD